jgi:DNA-binding LacI/PurR family transcriptional regulator
MVTIKEVAKRADVSIATVSYVINGSGAVSDHKRRAVLDAIAALNYRPSYRGRALQARRSMTMGLVLPAGSSYLADAYLSGLLAGLTDGAASSDYHLLLATSTVEQTEAETVIQLYRSGRVDGVVLLDPQIDDPRTGALAAAGVPYICAGRVCDTSPYVRIDGASGMVEAMAHLIMHDHERIALIQPPLERTLTVEQERGYRDALAEAGLPFIAELIIESGQDERAGYVATEELFALAQPPTAIIAGTASLAFGALHALHDQGRRAGREVALISFEDTPAAAHMAPPLTAVRQPLHTWGYALARGLMTVIAGNRSVHAVLQPQLIIRRSCGT